MDLNSSVPNYGQVCDVKCLMSSVWCRVCDVKCVMLSVWCQVCDVQCVMSSVWCPVCDFECVMLSVLCWVCDVKCVKLSVWCWVCDFKCLMSSVWCWVCDVECVMTSVWWPVCRAGQIGTFTSWRLCVPNTKAFWWHKIWKHATTENNTIAKDAVGWLCDVDVKSLVGWGWGEEGGGEGTGWVSLIFFKLLKALIVKFLEIASVNR